MKKRFSILLVLAISLAINVFAGEITPRRKLVVLQEAGTLSKFLTSEEKQELNSIIVSGPMDSTDFVTLNAMPNLASIDVSYAQVKEKSLPTKAFAGKSKLTSLNLPYSLASIHSSALSGTSIESMEIPPSVNNLKEQVFYSCKALKSIQLSPEMVGIPNGMLEKCTLLEDLRVPASCISIGENAFANSGLFTVVMPSTVTHIDRQSFMSTSNMTSVSIPSSVVSIGQNAFEGCGAKSYTSYAMIPPQTVSPFYVTKDNVLFVPKGAMDSYAKVKQWSDFTVREMVGLNVSMDTVYITDKVSSTAVDIASDALWNASWDQDWLKLSQIESDMPTCRITINYTGQSFVWEQKKAVITFATRTEKKTLVVILIPDQPYVNIKEEYRFATLKNLWEPIFCNEIEGAMKYEFEFRDVTGNSPTVQETFANYATPEKSDLQFERLYMVKVRAMVKGVYIPYGSQELIKTPSYPLTRLGAYLHNKRMATWDELVVCHKVEGASLYLYQFVDEKTGQRFRHYNKGNSLRVGDVDGLQANHSYKVTVLPRFHNTLSIFSVAARIYTPTEK